MATTASFYRVTLLAKKQCYLMTESVSRNDELCFFQ